MTETHRIAHELDRVLRKIESQMHRHMPAVDRGRVGPMGGLLLMQLESMQPCSIQSLATAMARDNSQLTRLIRNLETKNFLKRTTSPTDGRTTLLSLTDEGSLFIREAKNVLTKVVEQVAAPLNTQERAVLLDLLRKL